jgi:hypothetical protein
LVFISLVKLVSILFSEYPFISSKLMVSKLIPLAKQIIKQIIKQLVRLILVSKLISQAKQLVQKY